MVLRQHDLHGAPEEASLLQDHLKRSMGDSEPPDIFQHQSTGYLRTRGQETFVRMRLVLVSFTLIYSYIIMRRSTIDLFCCI